MLSFHIWLFIIFTFSSLQVILLEEKEEKQNSCVVSFLCQLSAQLFPQENDKMSVLLQKKKLFTQHLFLKVPRRREEIQQVSMYAKCASIHFLAQSAFQEKLATHFSGVRYCTESG